MYITIIIIIIIIIINIIILYPSYFSIFAWISKTMAKVLAMSQSTILLFALRKSKCCGRYSSSFSSPK